MTVSHAIVVLGMHRSGTSCLAGMLAAGGLTSAGDAVRNWDNARGHHEMLDVIRLNESVLAHSGGHWLSAPAIVRWTDQHATTRDRLLRTQIDGRAPLLKDPRTLLTLPFWRASQVSFRVVGIVRHPLAVARSLESWREMPLADGIALWSTHNRALAADRARHDYAVVDFEAPKVAVVAGVAAAFGIDEVALAAAYEEQLVHHDDGDAPALVGLDEAIALYRQLAAGSIVSSAASECRDGSISAGAAYERGNGGTAAIADLDGAATSYSQPPCSTVTTAPRLLDNAAPSRQFSTGSSVARRAFPRAELAAFATRLQEGAVAEAVASARTALAAVADASAVLVPVVTTLVRAHAHAEARSLIAEHAARLDDGLADLLHGKVLLASGDAATAVHHLEAACALPRPFFQARYLLPQALRGSGRHADARVAMQHVASEALYPHGPLATLAEWSWLDGNRADALAEMQRAITAAPLHRRGRLRTRRAEWLLAHDDPSAARRELLQAIEEDPRYGRSREVLGSLE